MVPQSDRCAVCEQLKAVSCKLWSCDIWAMQSCGEGLTLTERFRKVKWKVVNWCGLAELSRGVWREMSTVESLPVEAPQEATSCFLFTHFYSSTDVT